MPPAKRARDASGEPSHPLRTPCVHHHVLLKVKAGASTEAIQAAVAAAEALPSKVPTVISSKLTPVAHLVSPRSKAKGFTHQHLVVLGSSEAAITAYEEHPERKALAEALAPLVDDEITYDVPSRCWRASWLERWL